jgi:pimeloyl-ACP methyl ester carboxylesterase
MSGAALVPLPRSYIANDRQEGARYRHIDVDERYLQYCRNAKEQTNAESMLSDIWNSKVAELSDIDVPVLILHGKDDRNVYPAVSQELFKVLHAKNKEIKILDCGHWFYDAIFYNQAAEYSEDDRGNLFLR